ncbi:hypothetical protein [Tortoise microvirus 75]|nr:hypothetical protein [Tortoise microvirus 75]
MAKHSPKNQVYSKPPKGGFVYEPEEVFPGDYQEHENYREALRELKDPAMLRSKKYQEQQWRAIRIGANPQLLLHMRLMVARFKQVGIPVFPSEIVRSHERQNQLKADGFSKASGAKAPHPYGCAYDLVHSVRGWNLSKKQWEVFGHVGKELAIQRNIPMIWGGDWKFYDPAHWQLKEWRQIMTDYPWPPANKGIAHR